jgi:16S rRNA G966 N2-methylase RsmD
MSAFAVNFENSRFLDTSHVKAFANRLNWRCELLLTRHQEVIRGKRVLDIASHDGRFSYACLSLGAAHVVGIEGRQHLVEHARENLLALGCAPDQFSFVHGDVFDHLPTLQPGTFDTILCFGFFYHTLRQCELLREVKRLQAASFVLDTAVRYPPYARLVKLAGQLHLLSLLPRYVKRGAYLHLLREDHRSDAHTIDRGDLVAVPTEAAIEVLLEGHGFKWQRIAWLEENIADWADLDDYKTRRRASYLAAPVLGSERHPDRA